MFLIAISFYGYSELELIGAAALIALVMHLFNEIVWAALREACFTVWSDSVRAIRRVREDVRSLRREEGSSDVRLELLWVTNRWEAARTSAVADTGSALVAELS